MSVAKAGTCVWAILVATVLLSQTALASLGLGEARVQSFLGQNLEVRIALLQSGETELDALEVAVASADDYARLGVPSEALALELSATLDLAADPPVIRLRSRRPVTEPFVQVLLNARWASGRLLREYTLFLDPPAVPVAPPVRRLDVQPSAQEQPDQEQPARAQPVQEQPVQEAREQPAREQPLREQPAQMPDRATPSVEDVEAMPPPVAPQASADQPPQVPMDDPASGVVLVERGQTLWSIAAQWRPDSSLTMNQAMLAILERNPDAFMDNNVNRLRRGARLVLPEADAARAISVSEAARRIRQQAEAWEAGRAGLSEAARDPVDLAREAVEPEPGTETAGFETVGVEPEPETGGLEAADPESDSAASEMAQDASLPESALDEPEPGAMAEPLSQPRLELAPPDEELVAEAEAIEVERQRLSGQLAELESDMALNGLQSLEGDVLVDQIRQAIDSGDAGGLMVASEDLARLEDQLQDAREARRAEQAAARAAAARVETPVSAPPAFLERWMWPLVGAALGLVLLVVLIVLLRRRAARHDEDRLIAERGDPEPSAGSESTFSDTSHDEPGPESMPGGASGRLTDDQEAQAAALMGILSREDEDDEPFEYAGTETEEDPDAWERYDAEEGEPDLARLSDRLDTDELDERRSSESVSEMPALEDEQDDEDLEALFEQGETIARRPESMEDADAGPLTLDFDRPEQDPDAPEPGDLPATGQSEDDQPHSRSAEPETELLEEGGEVELRSSAGDENWFAVEQDEEDSDAAQLMEPDHMEVESEKDSSGSAEGVATLGDEDAEVKLDLARAYISMEDPDSARTLLDEVLSDGSPAHREQAQKLLDSLK